MDVFDLQAKISLDSSGFEKDLRAAGGYMQSFGSAVEGILGKIGGMLATVFTVDTIKNFVTGAVNEFARFEQLVGGVDTLFKGSSDELQKNADAAFQTAGMSANEYMDTATSFAASLIQALGGDTAAAVGMVDRAVVDMADNANKMGTDIGSIQHAYQGFAKQNYTMLDNLKLGYGGTKSEMARLINDTGILGDTIVEVSTMTKQGNFDSVVSFDVVVDAIHAVQENMGITGTTAQEAAQTIEGSVASMKAAWSNWLVGLGDEDADLSGLTDKLIGSFETAADNIIPVVQRIGESLTEVFADLTGVDLPGVTDKFTETFNGISDIVSNAFENIKLEQYADNIIGVVEPLVAGISEMFSNIDLTGIADAIIDMQTAVSTAWQGIIAAIDFAALGTAVNNGISMITDGIGLVTEAFGTGGVGEAASDFFAVIVDQISDAGPKIMEAGRDILGRVADIVQEIGAYIYEAMPENVQGLIDALMNFFNAFIDWLGVVKEKLQPFAEFLGKTFVDGLVIAWGQLQALVETIISLLTAGLDFLAGNFRTAVAVWEGDFAAAAAAVKEAWNGVLDFFGGIANGIMDIFGSLVGYMADIGRNMWEGLKNGLSEAISGVKEIGGKISEGFKGVFGINSPSRVFAEYGKFMAQGLGVGWSSEMDSVRRTMSAGLVMHGRVDFADSALGKSSSAVMNGMFSSASQGGGTYNINLNVDGRTVAQVVFDPLNNIVRQKGVTLGA